MTEFHFIRPLWLLSLIPLIALWWSLWRHHGRSTHWQQVIPENLLKHLVESTGQQRQRWPFYGLLGAWLISAIALAGPAWEKLPQPIHQSNEAVVIVMDLSPSMTAEDIKPSRLIRTRYKILDFLNQRDEGLTALVAYAGEAHVVSPLTDDTETISNLVPALEPNVLPLNGSNVEMAIESANNLLKDAGIARGQILLFTDGIASAAIDHVRELFNNSQHRLSIIGVGSDEGAPIPRGNGGFTKDRQGNIVIAKLNSPILMSLASSVNGSYSTMTTDASDIEQIQLAAQINSERDQQPNLSRDFDIWQDNGYWLVLLLLPAALLAFRRGWILSLGFFALCLPQPSDALEWKNLWSTPDQQAQAALEAGDPATAANTFNDRQWRGIAQYQNGDFEAAAKTFAEGDSVLDFYNLGNALLQQGAIDEAIEAYQTTLKHQPDHEDAQANLELAQSLKEKDSSQQNQDGGNQDKQDQQSEPGNNSDDASQDNVLDQQNRDSSQDGDANQQQGGEQNQQANQANSDSETNNPSASQEATGEAAVDEESAQQLAASDATKEALSEEEKQQLLGDTPEDEGTDPNNSKEEASKQAIANRDSNSENSHEDASEREGLLAQQLSQDNAESEQQQALEQWLRQVPDDPAGLLRRKFEYQHRQLRQQYRTGEWQPPENEAYERW